MMEESDSHWHDIEKILQVRLVLISIWLLVRHWFYLRHQDCLAGSPNRNDSLKEIFSWLRDKEQLSRKLTITLLLSEDDINHQKVTLCHFKCPHCVFIQAGFQSLTI